jgi:osmotically-inducible protein OsmY
MSALPKSLDEVLTQKINDRTGRRVRNLAVEMANGTVVLRGKASSFHVKQLAQSSVQEVLPQAAVRNGIVVS